MKKLSRLVAVVLTGIMLLTLTACSGSAVVETFGKKQIMNVINGYRSSKGLGAVEEVRVLSEAETALLSVFKENNLTLLDDDQLTEAYERWHKVFDPVDGWWFEDDLGYENIYIAGQRHLSLTTKAVPSQLYSQIEASGIFDNPNVTAVGIGLVTINGTTYWAVSTFSPET